MLSSVVAALLAATLQITTPHAAHEARLGGQFATTADDSLHLEGLWVQQRRFVLVVTGSDGAILPLDRLHGVTAHVEFADGSSAPLTLTADGTFDARIPALPLPARMTVVVTTAAGVDRAPLLFPTYTRATDADMFPLLPTAIPGTLPALLSALRDDAADARLLIERRDVLFVYAAAIRARDHGRALDAHASSLPPAAQARARSAVLDVVKAAWLLHVVSDSGTVPQASAALQALDAAVLDAASAFTGGTP